ncbi:MAG: Ig-like domain-containing protein, partial [Chloroflexi bacterium]|nr:Ig-like domain-containing protein [Chloroflexota bacterium]
YVWQFAVMPPKVVYITPGNGSAQVPIESPIVVQFNQPISLDSAREHVSLTASNGQSVPLNFDVQSETLTVTPTNRLDFEAAYVIKITSGLTGRSGGSGMRESVNALFTTVPLPKIISTDPVNGQRDAYAYTGFTIRFNTSMNHDTVMDHLTFNPPLSPTQVYTYGYGESFGMNFGAQPSTDYEVKIAPGIQDPYGNETKEALTVRFRTADLEPSVNLHVPNFVGTYNAYDPAQVYVVNTNIRTIEAKLYRLNADQFGQLQNYSYDNNLPLGAVVRQWTVSVEAPLNKQQATRLDMVEGGGTLAPGLYLLDVNSPQLKPESYYYSRRHVLVVSRHNITLKTSQSGALAWVTDYQSGQPVPNVPLNFFGYDNQQLGTATTDAQGLAALSAGNVIGAVALEPFAAASNDWSGGISQYDFGLSGGYSSGDQYRGYLYTDRPIYRPGQSVKFKGVLRREDDVKFSLLDVGTVRVVINSPNGENVFDQQLPVNSLGTFASEVKLADGAALGQYYVNVESSVFNFGAAFTVAAYRAPEFQVNVTPKDQEIVRGQSTSANIEVSYFFGGGVANRPVQWNVLAEDFNFTPPWGGNYRWTDSDDPWRCFDCWWYFRSGPTAQPQPILSGSGTTDARGNLTIELPGNLMQNDVPISQSVRLIVEATVTGNDNQVISGRGSLIRHSGDFYVGVQTRAYVGEANKPSTIDLIAVDWAGERLPNKTLEVSIVRREWENKFVPNEFGGGDWQYEQKDVPVTTSTVTTNERGETTIDYVPPQAGSYKITVKAADASGREVRASVFQWVTGREFVSWRRENNDRISLIGDKSSYVPGETARILIPSPFQGEHWALITVERGGILQRQLVKIVSNSQIFELPITSDLAPNVYVSVVLIKGQDATNKLSDYKVGLLPIEVKPIAQTLKVTLTPDRTTAQPGETVTYTVQVADSSGAAIQAEFSLDLVDKAVLSLLPRSPDEILNAFYGNRSLGVNTSSGLSVSVDKFNEQLKIDEQEQQAQRQALGYGGGAEAPMAAAPAPMATAAPGMADGLKAMDASAESALPNVEVRQEFADTAYWSPQVSTDAAGQASVTIKLPDNLTTWTFRGVGLTRDTKVGEATIDVVATKPLLIRPVTPRFFVVGDKAELSANVSNNTDNPLSVTLTLSSTGVTLLSDAQQIVQIPAKSEGSATWTVEAQDVPNVQLVFFAQSGDPSTDAQGVFVDASKPRLATGPDGS